MAEITFVTGNANKAKYFSELIDMPVAHQAVEGPEIQSLDLEEVAEHKARYAYERMKGPIIIEDVSLTISSMARLPGPLIKWFIQELGLEKICHLADSDSKRSAKASCVFSYYDGSNMKHFVGSLSGRISRHPKGDNGFGWNPIFIPEGSSQTLGEMNEETFKSFYIQIKPFKQLKKFLSTLDIAEA